MTKRRQLFIFFLLSLVACKLPPGASAQFIGFTSPQSVQSNLATNLNCTGAQQNFITGTTPRFNNIGQTQHLLTISAVTGATRFRAEIDGIDNQGNVNRISDVIESGNGLGGVGTVAAAGYFPQIQVAITCSPGTATFTASYSGTSAITIQNAGTYLTSQMDKINFFQVAGNVQQQDSFQTPFSSSAGTLEFQYASGAIANSTLTVSCNGIGQISTTVFSATLANVATPQVFQIPDTLCPFALVSYNNGGAGGTVTAEYMFSTPGRAPPQQQYSHITGTTATAVKATLGYLHTLSINTGAAGTVSVFDLATAACTGTPSTNTVAVITATTTTLQTFTYDVNMLNGICVKASVAMDLTVSYQ